MLGQWSKYLCEIAVVISTPMFAKELQSEGGKDLVNKIKPLIVALSSVASAPAGEKGPGENEAKLAREVAIYLATAINTDRDLDKEIESHANNSLNAASMGGGGGLGGANVYSSAAGSTAKGGNDLEKDLSAGWWEVTDTYLNEELGAALDTAVWRRATSIHTSDGKNGKIPSDSELAERKKRAAEQKAVAEDLYRSGMVDGNMDGKSQLRKAASIYEEAAETMMGTDPVYSANAVS